MILIHRFSFHLKILQRPSSLITKSLIVDSLYNRIRSTNKNNSLMFLWKEKPIRLKLSGMRRMMVLTLNTWYELISWQKISFRLIEDFTLKREKFLMQLHSSCEFRREFETYRTCTRVLNKSDKLLTICGNKIGSVLFRKTTLNQRAKPRFHKQVWINRVKVGNG